MQITIKTLPVTLLESGSSGEVALVELVGDIDGSTAASVQAEVLPLTATYERLLLEMTQVPYMSSAGLRMLLSVYRQVVAKDGQVVLVGLAEEIKDTMSITGFLDFFTTSDTIAEAYQALKVQG